MGVVLGRRMHDGYCAFGSILNIYATFAFDGNAFLNSEVAFAGQSKNARSIFVRVVDSTSTSDNKVSTAHAKDVALCSLKSIKRVYEEHVRNGDFLGVV